MGKNFEELRQRMSPESRKRSDEWAERELLKMDLKALRKRVARVTQADVAGTMKKKQSSISNLEKRGDMLISTMDEYVRALGGKLEVRAKFPGQDDVVVTRAKGLPTRKKVAKKSRGAKPARKAARKSRP